MIKSIKSQQGMVLFFSLIVLIVMTVIGVALAVNSSQSLRMAGAGGDRVSALAQAQGGLNLVINDNISHSFSTRTADGNAAEMDGTQNIKLMPEDNPGIDVNCQRTEKANAANLISCRRLEVSSSATFGRSGVGQLTVTTGIEQEVLTGS